MLASSRILANLNNPGKFAAFPRANCDSLRDSWAVGNRLPLITGSGALLCSREPNFFDRSSRETDRCFAICTQPVDDRVALLRTAAVELLERRDMLAAGPRVVGVEVASTTWSPDFVSYLQGNDLDKPAIPFLWVRRLKLAPIDVDESRSNQDQVQYGRGAQLG